MLIALLSSLSALLAFFYSKDGLRAHISGAGFLLLGLLVLLNGLNLVGTYSNEQARNEATKRNEQLVRENRNAQSYLAMTTLELDQPLEFGIFYLSAGSEGFFEGIEEGTVSERFVGILPIPVGSGEFARLGLEVPELLYKSFSIAQQSDGTVVSELKWPNETTKTANVQVWRNGEEDIAYGGSDCGSLDEAACREQVEKKRQGLLLEYLATVNGDIHIGTSALPSDSVPLAGVVLSKLLQTEHVGYLRIDSAVFSRLGVGKPHLIQILTTRTVAGFRFSQPPNSAVLAEECNRAIELSVELRPARPLDLDRFDCTAADICLEIRHRGNLEITPCELSPI